MKLKSVWTPKIIIIMPAMMFSGRFMELKNKNDVENKMLNAMNMTLKPKTKKMLLAMSATLLWAMFLF
jgi:hypothetical protein